MKLSEIIQEVEEWLSEFTYRYEITNVEQCFNDDYRVRFVEYGPNGESSEEETFTVTQNGKLINSNGDDVVELQLTGEEYISEFVQWVIDFKEKWYKKEEENPIKGTFDGTNFISKRGIKYSVYEGITIDGIATSDIAFIVNDHYSDVCEFVNWFYGATFLQRGDKEFIETLEHYVDEYEEKHPEVINLCTKENKEENVCGD